MSSRSAAAEFLHGCNYPWSTDGTTVFYGLDFGANIWGSHLGVAGRRAGVSRDFARMAALGFTVARWFVFCDGRAGIVYDEAGLPEGLDSHLFGDVDAALEIAREHGIRIAFVMLDHSWMFSGVRQMLADPVSGTVLEARLPDGRARVLLSAAGRSRLMHRILAPFVLRYGAEGERADLSDSVLAYELMNEPDFVVEEWERDLSSRVKRPLPFEVLAELVARFSQIVHAAHPSAITTIGCARLHNLWVWDDEALGLDVLQVHSYPDLNHPERDADLFGLPPSSLGVRRRVILGEFPADGPARHPEGVNPPQTSMADYLEFALEAGYAGAWPWSFSGTDAYGPLPEGPLRAFAARHPGIVNPRALA